MDILSEQMKANTSELSEDKINEILSKYGTLTEVEGKKILTTDKNYEIDVTDIISGVISNESGGNSPVEKITVANAQGRVLSTTSNTDVYDEYGNKIVVPTGFKITTDASHVTEGIVIEDVSAGTSTTVGSQFVWIPVGDVYTTTDTEKTSSNTTTITLGRYSWSGNTPTLVQPIAGDSTKSHTSEVAIGSSNFTEYQATTTTANAKAKNIKDFYERVIASQGYYIGRYEAGVSGYDEAATNSKTQPSGETNWTKYTTADGKDPQLVCKADQQIWNYVTQKKASELCQSMYTNKPYESDLVNSYAWDTAIVFIQTFGTEEDASSYAIQNKSTRWSSRQIS